MAIDKKQANYYEDDDNWMHRTPFIVFDSPNGVQYHVGDPGGDHLEMYNDILFNGANPQVRDLVLPHIHNPADWAKIVSQGEIGHGSFDGEDFLEVHAPGSWVDRPEWPHLESQIRAEYEDRFKKNPIRDFRLMRAAKVSNAVEDIMREFEQSGIFDKMPDVAPRTYRKELPKDPDALMNAHRQQADMFYGTEPDSMLQHAEYVPISAIKPFQEFDRRPGAEHGEDPMRWQALREHIEKHGILSPLHLEWNPRSGRAYLGEGNHRLQIAEDLGYSHLPVVVHTRGSDSQYVPGVPVQGPEPDKFGYIPSTLKPSEVGLPIRGQQLPNVHAGAQHEGAMVALYIPAEQAKEIHVHGGEPEKDLHITLAFFEDKGADRDDWEIAADVIRQVAKEFPPLEGEMTGTGRFQTKDDEPFIGLVSIHGITALHDKLVVELTDAGFPISTKFAYNPHITLKYLTSDQRDPQFDVELPLKLSFEKLYLVVADDRTEIDFNSEASVDPSQPILSSRQDKTRADISRASNFAVFACECGCEEFGFGGQCRDCKKFRFEAKRDPDFLFAYYQSGLEIQPYDHNLKYRNILEDLLKRFNKSIDDTGWEDNEHLWTGGEIYRKSPKAKFKVEFKQLADPDVQENALKAIKRHFKAREIEHNLDIDIDTTLDEKESAWDMLGDEPRWVQPHEELLADALRSWKGFPSDMSIHMSDERIGAPQPGSGSGKIKRAQAAALLREMQERGRPNERPLYRGADRSPGGFASWSEDKRIANRFLKQNGGQIYTLQPGEARGLRIADYISTPLDEDEREWIIDHGNTPRTSSFQPGQRAVNTISNQIVTVEKIEGQWAWVITDHGGRMSTLVENLVPVQQMQYNPFQQDTAEQINSLIQHAKTSMALFPDQWAKLMEKQNGKLYHYTNWKHIPSILQNGIMPWDQLGFHNYETSPDLRPRPGHVYMTTYPRRGVEIQDIGGSRYKPILEIDMNKLDPRLINMDEDWAKNFMDENHPAYQRYWEAPVTGESGGDIIDQHSDFFDQPHKVNQSINTHSTLAYKGVIPPHAITVRNPNEDPSIFEGYY